MNIELWIGAAIVATLALVSAADTRAQTAEPHTALPPSPQAQSPSDAPGLHNVVAFGPGCWSGSMPEGDAGFASLQSWGVRTVISVDGAVPDVARAARFGLRYVHLPIGYDGFDEARKLELVRAVLFYLQIMPLVNLEFALRCQSVAPNVWLHTQYL